MVGKTFESTNGHLKTMASWTALGVVGFGLVACVPKPDGPYHQDLVKMPNKPETKGVSEVVRAINGPNSDVGLAMLFHYDGTIETFGVDRRGSTHDTDPPPPDRTLLGEMQDVTAEIYETNPNCITWQHGGTYYTICR